MSVVTWEMIEMCDPVRIIHYSSGLFLGIWVGRLNTTYNVSPLLLNL